jgi:hypothetical protein
MKWREDETCVEWCLRVVETNDKTIMLAALLDLEAHCTTRPFKWPMVRGARDLLLAKIKLLEDQDDNDK